MVSVCLPSDALLQHLPSYLGFSYLGRRVSLHGCSSKAQPLLLTLNKGYLLTAALPDLQRGIAPLGPPVPTQPRLFGRGVAPPGCRPWPRALGRGVAPPVCSLSLSLSLYIYIYIHTHTYIYCVYIYLTLCNPMNWHSPGSSAHGIFQARILEWVAISFSNL